MNGADSSGWLESFAEGPGAEHFAAPLEDLDSLLVPTPTPGRPVLSEEKTLAAQANGTLCPAWT